MSHIFRMNEVTLIEKAVGNKDCYKVLWRKIPIGLIFAESDSCWRISSDLKGEFWALEEYQNKELAIEALVNKKQELDEYRLQQLSQKN